MKEEDYNKLYDAQSRGKKVRGKKFDGTWSLSGTIEAGMGHDVPQAGVRLGVYDEEGIKTSDEYLMFDDIEEIEVCE